MIVKEYMQEATHIRIFDDYCSTENTEDNKEEIKNIIISLLLNKLKNNGWNGWNNRKWMLLLHIS